MYVSVTQRARSRLLPARSSKLFFRERDRCSEILADLLSGLRRIQIKANMIDIAVCCLVSLSTLPVYRYGYFTVRSALSRKSTAAFRPAILSPSHIRRHLSYITTIQPPNKRSVSPAPAFPQYSIVSLFLFRYLILYIYLKFT